MVTCRDFNDSQKCDLVIVRIEANFGGLAKPEPKTPQMVHHSVEIKTRCIDCGKPYWFTIQDLKIEDFGQIWRTAVFSKQYKP